MKLEPIDEPDDTLASFPTEQTTRERSTSTFCDHYRLLRLLSLPFLNSWLILKYDNFNLTTINENWHV